jgi:hypothetical protein
MKSELLPSPTSDAPAKAARPEQQGCPEGEALVEARKAITADCRLNPERYLEEVRVVASGE